MLDPFRDTENPPARDQMPSAPGGVAMPEVGEPLKLA
jgi:hypothetical protein